MNFYENLQVVPGVTSVVGSGGKTSLLARLAQELPGTVVLTTSTHILPFDGIPLLIEPSEQDVHLALKHTRVVCVGAVAQRARLTAPSCGFATLARCADYVLVEADGSRGLPLKAHETWEPVIAKESTQTILVVGASGLGHPIKEAVHRQKRFCELSGCEPDDSASPSAVAQVINREGLATRVLINQVDAPGALEPARQLAAELFVPATLCSLKQAAI